MNGFSELSFDFTKGIASIRSSLLVILDKWWETHPLPWDEIDAITQCMMQMMAFKIRSLEVSLEGMPLVPNGKQQTLHVDFSTAAAIVRSIYEMAFIFHHIFVATENEDERDILLYIWKIKGYSNRQAIPIPEEMKIQKQQNEETIESLKNRVRDILKRINITPEAKHEIEDVIKKGHILKGYRFRKTNGVITKFESVALSESNSFINSDLIDGTYTFLSYQSHPSYLGIEQFGSISNPRQYNYEKINYLFPACFFASKFTNDACTILSDGVVIKKETVPNPFATINILSCI